MKPEDMKATDRELFIDETTSLYLEAFESDDFETQERILLLADEDAELAEAIESLHRGLIEEREQTERQVLRSAVASAMPSARIEQATEGPPTLGDIATEILNTSAGKLDAEGHRWISQLHDNPMPVPELKGLSKLRTWLETQFGAAPPRVAEACQTALQDLRLRRRAVAPEYQLAARKAKPPRPEGTE